MFLEISPCSPETGSVPRFTTNARFRGIKSRVFQKWATIVGT